MSKEKVTVEMEVVNPHAAGIDVGSRSHFVAVGQGEKQVKEFGVCHDDLQELLGYLQEHAIETVALESTGTYWQNLHAILSSSGLEVILCNGKFTKNIKGKKSDVLDCQWIQKLHTLGLLSNSFLPTEQTEILRTYCRHRGTLIQRAASCSNKMQKYLRLLNLRLDVVVNDICGKTGMKIIRSICNGEKNPKVLASYRDPRCKKSEEEIAKALKGNGRQDYLFALEQELEMYDSLQKQIQSCDQKIKSQIDHSIKNDDDKKQHDLDKEDRKKVNKNDIKG